MISEVLRDVRQSNGLSVRQLARAAGVSPATVDRIEHQRVSPTRSIDRILESIGYRLVVGVERDHEAELTREDRRSLAFHRLIARHVLDDASAVRAKAQRNLKTMRERNADGSADRYLDRWEQLIEGPEAPLFAVLLGTDEEARSLRQVTPFAGVLSEAERAAVYPRRSATRAS